MMNNRKQPFGYQMEFGAYIPQPAESETVRWIYQTYLAGASYQDTGGGSSGAGSCL